MRLFLILLLTRSLFAADVNLQQIAAAYQSIIDYQIAADVEISSGANPKTRFHIELTGSRPNRFYSYKKITKPLHYELLLTTDGADTWGYASRENKYVRLDAGQKSLLEAVTLREHHFAFFTRFDRVDELEVAVRHLRAKKCGAGLQCIVLKLEPAKDENWTETLWMEPERH